jgi:small subunit ribosomal protein S2
LRNLNRLPDALFLTDVMTDDIAVHEANRLGIPVIGIVDTNCNPDPIDYVIPANDDAIRAILLIAGKIADAANEGQQMRGVIMEEQGVPAGQADLAPASAGGADIAPADSLGGDDLAIDEDEILIS